jgi:hypothetical protein
MVSAALSRVAMTTKQQTESTLSTMPRNGPFLRGTGPVELAGSEGVTAGIR